MNFLRALLRPVRLNHRARLRDLHHFGLVSVFRRPSLFRLWEPLREQLDRSRDFSG